ncbi:MAG TPA: hypothetical protein VGC32_10120 [Solirubrobacterales bacterium]
MPDTGYGSPPFLRACDASRACREIEGSGPLASWQRMRAGSFVLARYRRSLSTVEVRLTPSPAGRMIGEHFAIRADGRFRYRDAQGVLRLPPDFATYLRGRHRQAVRTNVGHARRAGLRIEMRQVEDWVPGDGDSRFGHIHAGPVEWWLAFDSDGSLVGEAILSVDEEVALLHGLTTGATFARWMLHAEIVERLCGHCELLLVNSDEAYALSAGNQHFQRLLGYEVAQLRFGRTLSPRREPVLAVGAGEVAANVEV